MYIAGIQGWAKRERDIVTVMSIITSDVRSTLLVKYRLCL